MLFLQSILKFEHQSDHAGFSKAFAENHRFLGPEVCYLPT